MKKHLLLIAALVLAVTAQLFAQCGSCTITIAGNDASAHLVGAGTTLCITPTGNCTGPILVQGGTLCNNGTINNHNLAVYGSGSALYNYGQITCDSIWVSVGSASLANTGSITAIRMDISKTGNVMNNGTITCNYLLDSNATVNNNANITVNNSFGNIQFGIFNNNNYMKITKDFYNNTNAIFYTSCIINVGQSWFNSATIKGPTSGCGGFHVTDTCFNSGTVGGAGQSTDICDPSFGVINTGTFTGVTQCVCTNNCVVVGIDEVTSEMPKMYVYPNPAKDVLFVKLNASEKAKNINLYSLTGQKVWTKNSSLQANEEIPVGNLPEGLYFLQVQLENGSVLEKKVEVAR